jgi:hypothetical protein
LKTPYNQQKDHKSHKEKPLPIDSVENQKVFAYLLFDNGHHLQLFENLDMIAS